MKRITIIGLGLIGSSLGLALKKAKVEAEIMGHDKEPRVNSKAKKIGAVDKTDWNLYGAVKEASVVIIATPIMAIKDIMEHVAEWLPENCVVTDTGSTKAHVMKWAEEYLPKHVHFIGGHPMAGKETQGVDAADADLFTGHTYCLIPGRGAASEAVQSMVNLTELVGATPYFIDPVEHDSYVAAVSHLPLVISTTLVSAMANRPSWREISRVAATGFRDVSRLASGDPAMGHDICSTNRDNILYWVDEYIKELISFKNLLNDCEGLETTLAKIKEARDKWLYGVKERGFSEVPSFGEQMSAMLMGDKLARRSQEIMKRIEDKSEKPER